MFQWLAACRLRCASMIGSSFSGFRMDADFLRPRPEGTVNLVVCLVAGRIARLLR
jgi:hypothetical protein